MDVYKEALNYLESYNISGEDEVYPELEEDVFHEDSYLHSPLQSDCVDLPDTPTLCSPEALLERRLTVLKAILESEQLYLSELQTLLTPMKALKASAGTSQPVLSSQQVQTVFYQVPELRDLHRDFYTGLRTRLEAGMRPGPGPQSDQGAQVEQSPMETSGCVGDEAGGSEMKMVTGHGGFQLTVGDLFLKMVSQLRVYRGFIDNYESAVEIVRRCTQTNQCFRELSQSMMSCNGIDKIKTSYTFEALLYKPLDRITKTTLVLHDLLSTTPLNHEDHPVLQEALRLSHGFLSGLNEGSRCRREVTLSHALRRQVMRDGFVVDVCEGGRNLRHLFLYTDLLLCVKMKGGATGKQTYYRFCWYLPLAGLKLQWGAETERSADTHLRIQTIRAKMFQLRQELRHSNMGLVKGLTARCLEKSKRKMEQLELMLLTLAPVPYLVLHSPSGKSHMFLLSSLFELEEWREAILKLTGEDMETVPPDLLTLTSSCVKLRMTQQPPLRSLLTEDEDQCLCGTLSVAIQSACGLQQPASVSVSVEVDGYDFYPTQGQTHSSVPSLCPHWHQEFSFRVDGARQMRVVCVRETGREGTPRTRF
ncbi:active breakpoint cluster region-related protein [Osmerus mordax]|uniref:active breakpoint cluster region-related protein n=1 Tax=Osmerus mordax TaxID=8014 RepID=UPI00350FF203